MSTRPQVIALTVATAAFVTLTGWVWFSARAVRAKEEKSEPARLEVDLKRVLLVHNVTDPEPEKTLKVEMAGGSLAVGDEVIDLPTLATKLKTDSRYSGVDVVLVKNTEEGAWGEFTEILREVRATGREAYFYHSDGPCECTERDLVVHAGIRQANLRGQSATAVKCPPSNHSLRPAVAHP